MLYITDSKMNSRALEQHHVLTSMLEPAFGIPTDVTFEIMGFTNMNNYNDSKSKEIKLGEVSGHKVILALLSPVFKRGFFGPAADKKDVIAVRETTLEAFKIMNDYIYNKCIDWSKLSVLELYDIVNLAEKYDIPGLMKDVKTQMEKFPLTIKEVVDVYKTASQFSQFPDVSDPLLLKCTNFLQENLRSTRELLEFAAKHSGSGQEEMALKMIVPFVIEHKEM